MKIFEIREDGAWGPNDKGRLIGHIEAISKEEAKGILNITNGFTQLIEISKVNYEANKLALINKLKLYNI